MKLSDAQIQTINRYLANKPVSKAYVFGSYARGDADEKSDVDIMLELAPGHGLGLEFFRMAGDMEEILHSHVDLVTSDGLSPYIAPAVDREKVLIYEKQ